jgi:hypothetical protein
MADIVISVQGLLKGDVECNWSNLTIIYKAAVERSINAGKIVIALIKAWALKHITQMQAILVKFTNIVKLTVKTGVNGAVLAYGRVKQVITGFQSVGFEERRNQLANLSSKLRKSLKKTIKPVWKFAKAFVAQEILDVRTYQRNVIAGYVGATNPDILIFLLAYRTAITVHSKWRYQIQGNLIKDLAAVVPYGCSTLSLLNLLLLLPTLLLTILTFLVSVIYLYLE